MALHEKRDAKAAFEAYKAAVQASPVDPELLNNFGTFMEEIGNRDGARTLYGMALRASPGHRPAALNLKRLDASR